MGSGYSVGYPFAPLATPFPQHQPSAAFAAGTLGGVVNCESHYSAADSRPQTEHISPKKRKRLKAKGQFADGTIEL